VVVSIFYVLIGFIMDKGQLKSKLKPLLDPEIVVKESQWRSIHEYYLGYCSCFSAIVDFPLSNSFAQDFILSETLKRLNNVCSQ
jgi:hypothetical protein